MADWQFRIASVPAFAADLNAFCAADSYAPLSADGQTLPGCEFQGVARFDFDVFGLPSGLHVNARAMTLPSANPTLAAEIMALLGAQISDWFNAGTTFPVCPGLASFTNPTIGVAAPLQVGGQVWQRTPGGTVLISPAPTVPQRVWA